MDKNALMYNPEKIYNGNIEVMPSLFSRLTPFMRCMPDFFIGGAQKGGTTSLYYSIIQHPQIIPSKNKEIFYYGTTPNYEKGIMYYRHFFASTIYKKYREFKTGKHALCLDASTNTLDSAEAPKRILKDNPNAKVVFILRNPSERAYSHYKMAVKRGWDFADFEKALELEEQRIADGKTHPLSHPKHNYAYQRLGYKSRSIYVKHLKNWFADFPNKNLMVISSEAFFKTPDELFQSVCSFLEIDDAPVKFEKLNEGNSEKMKPETRQQLDAFFKPYNEALFQLLNKQFDW